MTVRILKGDCRNVLRTLPDESVHCVVTSPPYFGLRDYGVAGQIGLEPSPDAFVEEMVAVFAEVKRALRDDGTVWLNLGDSYAGSGKFSPGSPSNLNGSKQSTNMASAGLRLPIPAGLKQKDLIGIPWRVAFALQADGWYLRQDIIWSKPNPMPESVRDRCTRAHEYIFMLSKSARYHYDAEAIKEPGSENSHGSPNVNPGSKNGAVRKDKGTLGQWPRPGKDKQSGHGRRHAGFNERWDAMDQYSGVRNKRSVWSVSTQPFSEAHFATFPPALIEPCIMAGCPKGGTVLDPFGGAGTTGLVADRLSRNAILIELNPEYAKMAERRITGDAPLFVDCSHTSAQ